MSATETLSPQPTLNGTPLLQRIQEELDTQREVLVDYHRDLDKKWQQQTTHEPLRFIDKSGRIKEGGLKNFRRWQVFVPDTPATDYQSFNPRNLLDSVRRGEKRMLIDCYERLEKLGRLPYLKKYPSPSVGNPYNFHWKDCVFTYRWHKHMHFIGLANEHLRNRLPEDYIGLDLGSSYGIFPSLMKQEFPKSHQVLVDFPEQLLLAHYFLGSYLPGCRIAGVKELSTQQTITAEFIRQYDFVLVPVTMYSRIAPQTLNLFTNFASLGEMRRSWFKQYLESPAFTTANYFFCANRYESAPTYDTDVTVLDYPIWDAGKKIHFTTSPVFSHIYLRKKLFFYTKYNYPQYFEYIGRI